MSAVYVLANVVIRDREGVPTGRFGKAMLGARE